MSEQDRMDRAKRIRRMREGRRDEPDDEAAEESDADDAAPEEPTAAEEPTASDAEPEAAAEAGGTPASAETDGGATTLEEEPTEEAEDRSVESGEPVEPDDAVADAVERVSGASASVPSPEEVDETAAAEPAAETEPEPEPEPEPDPEPAAEADADAAAAAEETDEDLEGPASVAESASTAEDETRVLEFSLAGEHYCLDIQYIEEIVKHEHITRVPNTPEFVEGVVDLRGQITTILNPKVVIDKDDTEAGDLIVVFDGESFDEQGHIGWVVDDVRQVSPVTDDQVNDPPMGEDYINGVIDRDDDGDFVIWTTPDLALEEAT